MGFDQNKIKQSEELKGTPLLIFANKQDLVQALPPEEVDFFS